MIPYDELVAALQEWRAQRGLGVATPRQTRSSAQVAAMPAAPTPYAAPQPGRGTGGYAAMPAAAAAARPPMDDYEHAEGTEIREGTEEIDVDAEAVDVIDEQPEFDEE